MPTKKQLKEFIQFQLANDDRWAKASVKKIFSFQTADEQISEKSKVKNNIGFTGYDAEFLSSLAKVKNYSTRQIATLKKIMPKYWRQILDASDSHKLEISYNNWIKKTQKTEQLTLKI